MAAALFFLITGCLLQGAMFEEFGISVPNKMTVLRGSCMTIPCSFTVQDDHQRYLDTTCKAIWKRSGNVELFDSQTPQGGRGTLTGDLLQKNCSTTLNNLQEPQKDNYFFRLECQNPLKYSYSTDGTIVLTINDNLPAPTLNSTSLTVAEGDSVTLTCSALAPCLSLPPTLTWTPSLGAGQDRWEEQSDKTQKKISVVTFTASHLHDGQTMTCTAVYKREDKKADSSVNSSLKAIVLYSPKGTTVSVSPPGPVKEDQTVTLTCNSKANPAVKNYSWYRADGGRETLIGTGSVLNTTVSKDKRAFLCKAQNNKGTGQSNITQLDVQYSPKGTTVSVSPPGPVKEAKTVTLTCSSNANPPVKNYTWYRADGGQETIIGTGRDFNIQASEIRGPFFCKAENELGVGQSNTSQIDVQYSPKGTTVSVSPSGPVKEAQTVTLTCSSNANPPVKNYTWYRADGGQETIIGTGRDFNIQASEIRGPFFCKAENELGVGQSNTSQIDVHYSPKGTTVSVSPSGPVKEAQTVTLTCSSNANPPVKNYTWYRADGGQETIIGTGRDFNIQASEIRGPFFCKAENELGVGQSNTSQIDVHFAPLILPSPGCTRTVDRINCSCETSGNPPPTSLWYLNEFPATEPMDYVIRHEATNGKVVSVISMNPANLERNVTLLCNSSNALGSASQRFYFYSQVTDSGDGLLLPVFITAIVALLVLVFALLCIIRALRTNQNLLKSQSSSTTSTIAMSQLLPSGEGKEKPKTTDEDIYVNSSELRQAYNTQPAEVPELYHISLPSSGEGLGKKAEESQDVIYTSVIWKNKSKEAEASGYMDPSGSTQFMNNAQEMGVVYDQVKPKSRKQEPESEYAQVKFKDKNVTQH